MPLKGAILLALFIPSLPLCFFRPFYGICVWAVLAFVNPQSYTLYWSVTRDIPWATVAAVPTLAGFMCFTRGWLRSIATMQMGLLISLWVWFFVTSLASSNTPLFQHHSVATWEQFEFLSKILLMTVVTAAIIDSRQRLRIYLLVLAGSFALTVLKCLPFLVTTGGTYSLRGPKNTMVADNNDLALALNMTLPIFFFLAQTETNPWIKRICAFFFVVTIPTIFFTYSRGGLLALVTVMGLMLLTVKQRMVLIPVITLCAIIAIIFAPDKWKERMDPGQALDASGQARLNTWEYCRNLAADYPLTGGGFKTYTRELYPRYAPAGSMPLGPHSVYFGMLAEHGYVGLALYLTLVASCFSALWRISRRARAENDFVMRCYANMLRFSLVGFLASGIFLGRQYFDYYFAIVACVSILNRVSRDRADDDVEDDEQADGEELPEEMATGRLAAGA